MGDLTNPNICIFCLFTSFSQFSINFLLTLIRNLLSFRINTYAEGVISRQRNNNSSLHLRFVLSDISIVIILISFEMI